MPQQYLPPAREVPAAPSRRSRAGSARAAGRRRRALLPLASLLLAAWSLTCLVDGVGEPHLDQALVALATAAPYAALTAVPLVVVASTGRRWGSAAVALAAAVLPWSFVLGYATQDDAPRDGAPITVMILNTDVGGADAGSIVAAVRARAVDVLVLTDLSSPLAHDLTLAGLDQQLRPRWVDVPADDPRGGIGLWSRLEVRDAAPVAGTVWPAARATVLVGTGAGERRLTLVSGHAVPPLGASVPGWRTDLESLGAAASAATGPVVVMGNLNAAPWHPEFRRLLGPRLVDAADATGRGLRPTWPSSSPVALLPLDHVLVGGGVGAREVESFALAGSDHRALVATLLVPRD